MLKMVVTFKVGLPVRQLPDVQKYISQIGGEAIFVPQESNEAQDTSTNTGSPKLRESIIKVLSCYQMPPENYGIIADNIIAQLRASA